MERSQLAVCPLTESRSRTSFSTTMALSLHRLLFSSVASPIWSAMAGNTFMRPVSAKLRTTSESAYLRICLWGQPDGISMALRRAAEGGVCC